MALVQGTAAMRIKDFGTFDQGVTVFGGPYSNLQALQALADLCDGPAVCTGDVVAYGGDPAATVDLIRKLGWPVVAGNCELQIAEDAPDCGCGFGEGTACDLLSVGWYPAAKAAIDDDARAWMASLPDIGTFMQNGRRYAVLHGGATKVNRFLWPTSEAAEFEAEIAALEAWIGPIDGIIAGHSGIAFHRWIGEHHWINAGALGLPPHDGRPETRYAVLQDNDVTFHHLSYDHQAARSAMEVAGLIQGYHAALTTGIWPSEDTLPPELRR
jgi:predicted phosphodiesterase